MTLPLPPNKKRGEFTLKIGNETRRLRASFANIALFEQHTNQGIYTLADKLSKKDIRLSDFVNIVYYFDEDKGLDGHSQEDTFELFDSNELPDILAQIAEFLTVLFGVDNTAPPATGKKKK